ncbi:MAG TPA: TIR domain-containing protein [Acidimicrobiales bacterium]|jgi:hypothetical protein|nr:TIR domain-containing protein [Acidimicrobiales bacterium]
MARRIFYSFHFDGDYWRTQQVRNIGALEHDEPVSKNDWEEVKQRGDQAIENWIAAQLGDKSCLVCLIGTETSSRPWVIHEIQEAWNAGKGVVGIHIHNLRDSSQKQSAKGTNPFTKLHFVRSPSKLLSSVANVYDLGSTDSQVTYQWIANHLEAAVEEAIAIRDRFTL